MFTAVPAGLFSRDYTLERDSQEVGAVSFNMWSEQGTLTLGDRSYPVTKSGWIGASFCVTGDGGDIVATPRGLFKSGFDITSPDGNYSLQPAGLLTNSYELVTDDASLGTIHHDGWLGRQCLIELDDRVPAVIQAFAFYLVATLWHRAAAASHH